jgi:zinc protease
MKKLSFIIILFLLQITAFPQQLKLNDEIPLDKTILKGKLDNGLTYYIKENKKPEDRAVFRLVINAGSILENDDQQGLAHLVEHMAFNGSTHFEKNDLINYIESIGMKFGTDLNASTSFDETIYKLEVPTDNDAALNKGFLILEDWAHNLSFNPAEIDKERGVVIEEWRLGRGADARMFDKQAPVLLKDSKYANRLTIGKKDIIEKASYETLKSFYYDWYRPDLMALIVVGDFDKTKMESMIKKYFSEIPRKQNPRERVAFTVPDQDKMLFSIVTDPEATDNAISFYHKLPSEPQDKVSDYRRALVEIMYNRMLSARLAELTRKADPPFLKANSGKGNFVRNKDVFMLRASVKDNGIESGLEALLNEAQRVKKYGFTESELKREKQTMLSSIERAYKERNKSESVGFAEELIRNFLTGEPSPGISYEYEIYKQFIPGITIDEINKLSDNFIQEKNSVLLVNAPDKAGLKIPTEQDLKNIFDKVKNADLKPYEDKFANVPLIDKPPVPSAIVSETKNDELKLTELKLANGVRVILKPTDFKDDEISFSAYCNGGTSLADNSLYIPASTATSLIQQSGVGKFNVTQLHKMLAGKVASVSPFVSEISEGLSGSSSVKDLETMFQLIYLNFTAPQIDSTSFVSYKTKMKNYLANRGSSPDAAFQDTVQVTLGDYNYRRMPWNLGTLDKMDIDKSLNFYKERFADASGFTFIFVGSFDIEKMKPLIQTYLGGLPSLNRGESLKDLKIFPPRGVISKKVLKGVEPKSSVLLTFSGDYDWNSQNNYNFLSMLEVLKIKLREILREDKSGVYGVSVKGSPIKYPKQKYEIDISFGCAPENAENLVQSTLAELDSLKNYAVSDIYINKIKETQKREFELNLKENKFWLSSLNSYYFYNNDLSFLMKYPQRVDNFNSDAVQKAAQKYFDENNYVKVILYPEKN